MKKGLSPLIATVLLIAFTIAMGSLIVAFFNESSREQVSDINQQTRNVVDCGNAAIRIFEVTRDGNDLVVNVNNIGTETLGDLTVITKDTSTSPLVSHNVTNVTLEQGELESLIVDWGSGDNPYEVTVNTECPSIFSTVRNETGEYEPVFR